MIQSVRKILPDPFIFQIFYRFRSCCFQGVCAPRRYRTSVHFNVYTVTKLFFCNYPYHIRVQKKIFTFESGNIFRTPGISSSFTRAHISIPNIYLCPLDEAARVTGQLHPRVLPLPVGLKFKS